MELTHLISGSPKRSYSYLPTQVDEMVPPVISGEDFASTDRDDHRNNKYNTKIRNIGIWSFIFGFIFFLVIFLAGNVSTGTGEIFSLGDPQPSSPVQVPAFKTITHPDPPTGLWGNIAKPYPTGAFWTNLVVDGGDGPVGVYPYGIKTLDIGIQVSYGASRRIVTKHAITDNFVADLQLAAVQANVGTRCIEKYDKVSVTMGYKTGANGKYRIHIVKSSPFVTVVYENAAPMISSNLMHIIAVEQQIVKDSTGVQYIVTLGNFQKWLVYCSEPLALSWTGNTLSSLAPIKGFIRVAFLPIQNFNAAFTTLMQYIRKYPTGGSVQLLYPTDTTLEEHIEYTTEGTGSLLMLALPHHISAMTLPDLRKDENLRVQGALAPLWSIKGKLKAVVGTTWRLHYNLTQVGWNYILSEKLSTSHMDEVGADLVREVSLLPPTATDPYAFGKQLQRLATLALLADNLGIAEARRTAITSIEQALTPWLLGTNANPLVYDSTYGGLLTTTSVVDKQSDFGSGWYNDHHFHYGYIIYAAAAVLKIDAAYFADPIKKASINMIIRDICNMKEADTEFPTVRHKDYYDGHSWASGLIQQSNGKGQESSSEAVNAYYAVYLYALANTDSELQRFAQSMLTMEIDATKVYWHINNAGIYDTVFGISGMVGNIGALDVTASTWFGDNPEYVHGINIMPITPVTAELFDAQYVLKQYPVLAARLEANRAEVTQHQDATSGFSAECASNSLCKGLGITGMCCPTPEGMMLGCCDAEQLPGSKIGDEWLGMINCDLAVVDRDTAWNRLVNMTDFGVGNSKANSLYWTATRTAPVPGFNASATYSASSSMSKRAPSTCASNSACDALGMVGECCPASVGVRLQCCPVLSAP